MIASVLFAIGFVLVSIPIIALQFARPDQPDPLPITLHLIPIWAGMFLGSIVTI